MADLVTKRIIVDTMHLHQVKQVVGDWIRLTYIHNPGAAFGLFPGSRVPLVAVSVIAVIIVVWIAWRRPGRLAGVLPLGLILGGALGNLVDRVRLGEVVDFIQVGIPPDTYWPVFNVADSAVSVGVLWLALGLVVGERAVTADGNDPPTGKPEADSGEERIASVAAPRDDR